MYILQEGRIYTPNFVFHLVLVSGLFSLIQKADALWIIDTINIHEIRVFHLYQYRYRVYRDTAQDDVRNLVLKRLVMLEFLSPPFRMVVAASSSCCGAPAPACGKHASWQLAELPSWNYCTMSSYSTVKRCPTSFTHRDVR